MLISDQKTSARRTHSAGHFCLPQSFSAPSRLSAGGYFATKGQPLMTDSDSAPENISVPLYSSAKAASGQPEAQPESQPETQPGNTPASPCNTQPGAQPDPSPDRPAPHVMSLKDAVLNCRAAFMHAHKEQSAREKNGYLANKAASLAFRRTMPLLTSEGNIRGFMACVAHGILIEAIPFEDAPRLTAIARLAFASLPREPKSPGRPSSQRTKVGEKINRKKSNTV
jgi:hypothetical protein